MMSTVWVLGSLNMDSTYAVETLPQEGMTVAADACCRAVGGKGFNQAVAACRCGAPVRLIGAVGEDDAGLALLQAATREGVDTTLVNRLPHAGTGTAVVLVDAAGANLIVVHGGANRQVSCPAIPFAKGDFAVAQLETNLDAVLDFFGQAKSAGAVTVLNPSPFSALSPKLVAVTDLLVANEHEAAAFACLSADAPPEQLVFGVQKQGIRLAVVTLGGDGAVLWNGDACVRIEGHHVPVVDTQGAGDAFLGTLLGWMAQGHMLAESARFANLVAAECVGHAGSTLVSYPSPERLSQLRDRLT